MLGKSLVGAIAVTAALWMVADAASAADDSKYPNLKGQWVRARIPVPGGGQAPFDPTKPVLLKGKVVKIEWVNPHAWIHI